jgi:hypothetical protein
MDQLFWYSKYVLYKNKYRGFFQGRDRLVLNGVYIDEFGDHLENRTISHSQQKDHDIK